MIDGYQKDVTSVTSASLGWCFPSCGTTASSFVLRAWTFDPVGLSYTRARVPGQLVLVFGLSTLGSRERFDFPASDAWTFEL
jgi:hypothetical protein